MKLKYWIILLVFAFIVGVIGSWMKIVHKPYADSVLTFSMIFKIVTIIFIVIKLKGNQKLKDLMNK